VARRRWRTILATLLIVRACVLAPLSVVAIWTRNQVTNTDRYVATVSPLASDPAIQNAIADQITAQVFTYLDVQGLTAQAAEALAQRGTYRPGWPTSSRPSPSRSPTGSRASPATRSARSWPATPSPTPGSRPTGPPTPSWSRP
jgi:hypothetical protein